MLLWRGAGRPSTGLPNRCDEASLPRDELRRCWHCVSGSPKRPRMRFLVTVFWALVAVLIALFSYRNWTDVTLNLWGDIEADIKIPILLFIIFLLGWLPTWLIMRARLWTSRRRVEALERSRVTAAASATAVPEDGEPVI
jgi:lipopolysaccharide assembly protein A